MIYLVTSSALSLFFLFTDPAPTEIYTLSLHTLFRSAELADRLEKRQRLDVTYRPADLGDHDVVITEIGGTVGDRKSTRLNSSHGSISYAVFCLKKKKKRNKNNKEKAARPRHTHEHSH